MKQFDIAVQSLRNGDYKKSEKIFRKLLSKKPKNIKVLINLGIAYKNLGKIQKAMECYKKALEIEPNNFAACNNLANLYLGQRQYKKAKENFLKAIAIKSNYAEAYGNMGSLFQSRGNLKDAKKYYNKALGINPKLVNVLSNLSGVYEIEGRLKKAFVLAEKAYKLDKSNTGTKVNLANILRGFGKLNEAKTLYKSAIKTDPRLTGAYNNLLDILLRLCEWEEAERIHQKIDVMGAETPFSSLRFHKDLNQHLKVARSYSKQIKADSLSSNLNLGYWLKGKKEKIKLGYLSGNFCRHPVASVIYPLLKFHNRKKFEVFAYSYGPNDASFERKNIANCVDKFVDIKGFGDAQAAKRINRDKIDILVDLTGHTQGGRMGIMAHHPSPFQISYLGFPGTTGAEFIEFIIIDATLVPREDQAFYSEKLIYLPGCYQINAANSKIAKKFIRKDFGLSDETFIFCALGRPYKFSPELFTAWMKILRRVPKSVLIIWKESDKTYQNLCKYAKREGIDPKRLVAVETLRYDKYLSRISLTDLALDTWDYSGGATSADLLFMGVPIITLKGWSYISRMTDSMLKSIGLSELIANSPSEYVNLAVKLAKDRSQLNNLRTKLKANKKTSTLFKPGFFVKNLEQEYIKIMGTISAKQE